MFSFLLWIFNDLYIVEYESMVSLVSRRYMRGENGKRVCLAYSNRKTKCQN